jgi:hypothetical protein
MHAYIDTYIYDGISLTVTVTVTVTMIYLDTQSVLEEGPGPSPSFKVVVARLLRPPVVTRLLRSPVVARLLVTTPTGPVQSPIYMQCEPHPKPGSPYGVESSRNPGCIFLL